MNSRKMTQIAAAAAVGILVGATAVCAARWPRHPKLTRAFNQLQQARAALDHATHDCGGHRVAAIKLIDQALGEVRSSVAYANAHPGRR